MYTLPDAHMTAHLTGAPSEAVGDLDPLVPWASYTGTHGVPVSEIPYTDTGLGDEPCLSECLWINARFLVCHESPFLKHRTNTDVHSG